MDARKPIAIHARWRVRHLPEELGDIHVSCGVGDEQWEAFSMDDPRAFLSIIPTGRGTYSVLFAVHLDPETAEAIMTATEDFWLSPNVWDGMDSKEENAIEFEVVYA